MDDFKSLIKSWIIFTELLNGYFPWVGVWKGEGFLYLYYMFLKLSDLLWQTWYRLNMYDVKYLFLRFFEVIHAIAFHTHRMNLTVTFDFTDNTWKMFQNCDYFHLLSISKTKPFIC